MMRGTRTVATFLALLTLAVLSGERTWVASVMYGGAMVGAGHWLVLMWRIRREARQARKAHRTERVA